jgi:hypothetical protein
VLLVEGLGELEGLRGRPAETPVALALEGEKVEESRGVLDELLGVKSLDGGLTEI